MTNYLKRLLQQVKTHDEPLAEALKVELQRKGRYRHGTCDCEKCKGDHMDARHKHVEIWYPRQHDVEKVPDDIPSIEIGLMDVRAADDIRITYDYDRDGWVCWQARFFSWDEDDIECDRGWTEVAFCPAWQLEEEED